MATSTAPSWDEAIAAHMQQSTWYLQAEMYLLYMLPRKSAANGGCRGCPEMEQVLHLLNLHQQAVEHNMTWAFHVNAAAVQL